MAARGGTSRARVEPRAKNRSRRRIPFEGRRMAPSDVPSCLVLDVRLPDANGLDLQRRLSELGIDIPIIFITGHGDIPMSVRAMKAGAVEFLTKPFSDQELLDAIQCAIERDRAGRHRRSESSVLRQYYSALTPREREVFPLVASGLLNKQIAAKLGTSEKTIKIHRSQVMQKMKADSFADLVRKAEKLQITSSPSPRS
ncbi:MAG: response regulator transcription factor [Candidatus Micrarchaeaceae archaeon]